MKLYKNCLLKKIKTLKNIWNSSCNNYLLTMYVVRMIFLVVSFVKKRNK